MFTRTIVIDGESHPMAGATKEAANANLMAFIAEHVSKVANCTPVVTESGSVLKLCVTSEGVLLVPKGVPIPQPKLSFERKLSLDGLDINISKPSRRSADTALHKLIEARIKEDPSLLELYTCEDTVIETEDSSKYRLFFKKKDCCGEGMKTSMWKEEYSSRRGKETILETEVCYRSCC